jgi:hypothetical protein
VPSQNALPFHAHEHLQLHFPRSWRRIQSHQTHAVQAITITMLYCARQLCTTGAKDARVLVVMPTNVLANWMAEAARWLKHFSSCRTVIQGDHCIRLVCALSLFRASFFEHHRSSPSFIVCQDTLGPLNSPALEIFFGCASPCLIDLFTPKMGCRCLNIYRSYGISVCRLRNGR